MPGACSHKDWRNWPARRGIWIFHASKLAGLPDNLASATERQLESIEAFTSRFARTVDLLVNKVLRGLDRMELLPQGTLLDVVNRAEKRGFIQRAADLREMKDVRNIIARSAP